MATLTPTQLHSLLKDPEAVQLIDVRSGAEFQGLHVKGARLHPLHELNPDAIRNARSARAEGPAVVLCQSGQRAAQAVERLNAAGVEALAVEGGTTACVEAGLPVVRGKKAVSLERQVRIAAGSLVATGVVLGWFVHPWILLLPAFVGCGLVFSGLTDTCGMGSVLARMPWNSGGHAAGPRACEQEAS